VLPLDGLLAFHLCFKAVEALGASTIDVSAFSVLLHAVRHDAFAIVADAVHIALITAFTLLAFSQRSNANAFIAGLVSTALEALLIVALCLQSKTVALVLDTLLVTSAVLILHATVVEASLNDTFFLDAGDDARAIKCTLTIFIT